MRDFFESVETPPEWFSPDDVREGRRSFHANSDLFIPAFLVATLRNLTTLMAKTFATTGRVLSPFAPRRIRQNVRHFIEIMLPGSMLRDSDGWKQSVRIRFVHGQVRRLIRANGVWDESRYGVPLSQAHMALASANFSARTLSDAIRTGAYMRPEAMDGYMQIWRYASTLMGVPEKLIFEGDFKQTLRFSALGHSCEPPVGQESQTTANTIVRSLPDIANRSDPAGREKMVVDGYRYARALLGNDLANQLGFPRQFFAKFVVPHFRSKRYAHRLAQWAFPGKTQRWRGNNFGFLLETSMLEDLSYRIPDRLKSTEAKPW